MALVLLHDQGLDIYGDIPQVDHVSPGSTACASADGGRRFRLPGVGMIRLSLRIMMIGLVAGSLLSHKTKALPVGWNAPVLPARNNRIG